MRGQVLWREDMLGLFIIIFVIIFLGAEDIPAEL